MKLGMVGVGLLALSAFGCASSQKLEDEARVHQLRADAAASRRDYTVAAEEQHEAAALHEKAVKRAYKEGNAQQVTVPSAVPPPNLPPQPPYTP